MKRKNKTERGTDGTETENGEKLWHFLASEPKESEINDSRLGLAVD